MFETPAEAERDPADVLDGVAALGRRVEAGRLEVDLSTAVQLQGRQLDRTVHQQLLEHGEIMKDEANVQK